MRTPTLLYVDNSTLDTLLFGTLKRPYAHIQDGVYAAAPEDTVFVHVGVGAVQRISRAEPRHRPRG